MNKQELMNSIENIKKDFKTWDTLKTREVEQGIITKEQYVVDLEVSKQRLERQVEGIEKEIEMFFG